MHGLPAWAVCKEVDDEFGTDLNERTIRGYVQEGLAGESPKKRDAQVRSRK